MRITTEYPREVYLVLKEPQISSALPAEASASSVGSPKRSTCRGDSTWSWLTAITRLGERINQLPAPLVRDDSRLSSPMMPCVGLGAGQQERHRCSVRQTLDLTDLRFATFIAGSVAERIRTVFLVWSPAKRSSSDFHELPRFPFTEMNDDDVTTGNRQA